MTSILFISLAIAVVLYVFVVKTSREEPHKARKQEKAEIMRQLLALSDREESISAAPPPLRSATSHTSQRSQAGKPRANRRGCSPVAPASRPRCQQ
jgi:hypothetical protein